MRDFICRCCGQLYNSGNQPVCLVPCGHRVCGRCAAQGQRCPSCVATVPIKDRAKMQGGAQQPAAAVLELLRAAGLQDARKLFLPADEFLLEREPFARGAFGTVWKAQHSALKAVAVKGLVYGTALWQASSEQLNAFVAEADIGMRLARHPRVCQHLGICYFKEGPAAGWLCLVMRLYSGDSLAQQAQAMPLQKALSIATDMAEGLAFLHSQELVVRDIHPGNVLLDADDRAVLSDFGISRLLEDGRTSRPARAMGFLPFMAPEIFRFNRIGKPYDIWSLACVVLYTLSGQYPWHGVTDEQIMHKVCNGERPSFPAELYPVAPGTGATRLRGLLEDCLKFDPAQRPTAQEVLQRLNAIQPTPQVHTPPQQQPSAITLRSQHGTYLCAYPNIPEPGLSQHPYAFTLERLGRYTFALRTAGGRYLSATQEGSFVIQPGAHATASETFTAVWLVDGDPRVSFLTQHDTFLRAARVKDAGGHTKFPIQQAPSSDPSAWDQWRVGGAGAAALERCR